MTRKPELWNRQELYLNIWKHPIGQIAPLYGISKETLADVCKKLKIPRPQRGYWRKIQVGMHIPPTPLPAATNLPFVPRPRKVPPLRPVGRWNDLQRTRANPAMIAIRRVENTPSLAYQETRKHRLTSATEMTLRNAKHVHHGSILRRPRGCECLDVRVSKKTLDRALQIMNAVLILLEEEGFSVKITEQGQRTVACIFEEEVPFYLREQLQLHSRRRRRDLDIRTCRYESTQNLEFRAGLTYSNAFSLSDSEQIHLENAIHVCVAALMREARVLQLAAAQEAKLEAQRERERERLSKLSKLVIQEEAKLHDLQNEVATWKQAGEIRRFIAAVEIGSSSTLGASSSNSSNRWGIKWMNEQADRLDPFRPSPASILDRKSELKSHAGEVFLPIQFEHPTLGSGFATPPWRRGKRRAFH